MCGQTIYDFDLVIPHRVVTFEIIIQFGPGSEGLGQPKKNTYHAMNEESRDFIIPNMFRITVLPVT